MFHQPYYISSQPLLVYSENYENNQFCIIIEQLMRLLGQIYWYMVAKEDQSIIIDTVIDTKLFRLTTKLRHKPTTTIFKIFKHPYIFLLYLLILYNMYSSIFIF